jgi:twitching motility protein PilI
MGDRQGGSGYDLLAEIDARAREHQLVSDESGENKQTHSYLSFSVCDQMMLIPINEITELVSSPAIVEVPVMKPWMRGIANVRGSLLPLTDLESFFCQKRQHVGSSSRVLVIEREGSRFGLLVPEVFGIKDVAPGRMSEPENMTRNPLAGFCGQQVGIGGKTWFILDVERLVSDARFMHVAA